ncbi:MAG TPA: hypothetical protein VKE95_13505 [Burkholderiales bacterium]|nr:hypothetical protein [Burkholderiales bacterium]
MSPYREAALDRDRLEEECARWDWARTAGVSASELRAWLTTFNRESWNELQPALAE